LPALE